MLPVLPEQPLFRVVEDRFNKDKVKIFASYKDVSLKTYPKDCPALLQENIQTYESSFFKVIGWLSLNKNTLKLVVLSKENFHPVDLVIKVIKGPIVNHEVNQKYIEVLTAPLPEKTKTEQLRELLMQKNREHPMIHFQLVNDAYKTTFTEEVNLRAFLETLPWPEIPEVERASF